MSRPVKVSIGHEHGPTPDASRLTTCPACGKEFYYLGGYGVGSKPACSYKCQNELLRQYKQSREYREIRDQLNPPLRRKVDVIPGELPDGPLDREQLVTLHKMYPRRDYESFQLIAELVKDGRTNNDIMGVTGINDHVVGNIRKMLGCQMRRGRGFALTESQRNDIVAMRKDGALIREITEKYHVSKETIRKVLADDSGSYYIGRRGQDQDAV